MEKMLNQIMKEIKSGFNTVNDKFDEVNSKFDEVNKRLTRLEYKTDEHTEYLKAILESKEVQKAKLDNQQIQLSKIEGVLKAQAGLALKELK